MGLTFNCPVGNPNDPTGGSIDINGIGSTGSGIVQPNLPNMGAKKLNLCIYDVQQTIQEGRASGNIRPFNISGATSNSINGV